MAPEILAIDDTDPAPRAEIVDTAAANALLCGKKDVSATRCTESSNFDANADRRICAATRPRVKLVVAAPARPRGA